jgi:hypothetical protein
MVTCALPMVPIEGAPCRTDPVGNYGHMIVIPGSVLVDRGSYPPATFYPCPNGGQPTRASTPLMILS